MLRPGPTVFERLSMHARHPLAVLLALGLCPPAGATEAPDFGRHVTPVLYKLGCSAGGCHGAFAGKGGFRLSLFAGQPDPDYPNVRGPFGRRIDTLHPEKSLLLLKPTGAVPHGGGVRLRPGSSEYELLRAWIASGARYDPKAEPQTLAVRVEPATLTVPVGAAPRSLRVLARFSDGKEEDVTRLTRFESLDPAVAVVDEHGKVRGERGGSVAVLAHYAGQVGFTSALVPGGPPKVAFPDERLTDPVDRLLVEKLRRLNIVPAPPATDAEFLRRAYLDVTGVLPLPEDVRTFLADPDPGKRRKLIDRLLTDPLHAALWAGKLCDMVGADDRFLGNNVYSFHDWFRNKLEANLPWDRLAHGVLCATAADGRTPEQIREDQKRLAEERKAAKGKKPPPPDPKTKFWQSGYAQRNTLDVFYNNLINMKEGPNKRRILDAKPVALRVAHTFLGVRLECAQCHKHPHDRWTQNDFYSFAAAFSYVEFGVDPTLKAQKAPLAGTHASAKPVEIFHDPDTGEEIVPRVLGGAKIDLKPGVDPRVEVWKWMVREDNPWFARAIVNRVWEHYLGRGLIEPADAQAAANPPSHPDVLDELARDFVKHKYDLRHLHRRILNTAAYQRASTPNETNARDERHFSRRILRRLSAEQALDAIAQVTGTPVKLPKRYADFRPVERAVEIAMSRVGGDDGYVLQIFGKPLRTQNCDCERSGAPSLSQVLYLYNDEKLVGKINDPKGRAQKLVQEVKDDRRLLEELYLLVLTRLPTPAEIERSLRHLRESPSRLEGYQDIVWSLLNRSEFIVNH
jgi:hypothetical protein